MIAKRLPCRGGAQCAHWAEGFEEWSCMRYPRNQKNLTRARFLRRNMTPQERHLWYDFLRFCRPRFRRQELIGPYIADFLCYDANLIIEVDGSQHFSPETKAYDADRTAYFHNLGIQVMRIDNGQINRDFPGVCMAIMLELNQCGVNAVIESEK